MSEPSASWIERNFTLPKHDDNSKLKEIKQVALFKKEKGNKYILLQYKRERRFLTVLTMKQGEG